MLESEPFSAILIPFMSVNVNKIEMSFKSHLKFTEIGIMILSFLKNLLAIGDDDYFKIEISLREAISNAIIHGNRGDSSKLVRITFDWEKSLLRMRIGDENPRKVEFAEILNKIRQNDLLSSSGRGILIIKNYMDRVDFVSTDRGNEMVLEKRLP